MQCTLEYAACSIYSKGETGNMFATFRFGFASKFAPMFTARFDESLDQCLRSKFAVRVWLKFASKFTISLH